MPDVNERDRMEIKENNPIYDYKMEQLHFETYEEERQMEERQMEIERLHSQLDELSKQVKDIHEENNTVDVIIFHLKDMIINRHNYERIRKALDQAYIGNPSEDYAVTQQQSIDRKILIEEYITKFKDHFGDEFGEPEHEIEFITKKDIEL